MSSSSVGGRIAPGPNVPKSGFRSLISLKSSPRAAGTGEATIDADQELTT